jgi:hypothetical protein
LHDGFGLGSYKGYWLGLKDGFWLGLEEGFWLGLADGLWDKLDGLFLAWRGKWFLDWHKGCHLSRLGE